VLHEDTNRSATRMGCGSSHPVDDVLRGSPGRGIAASAEQVQQVGYPDEAIHEALSQHDRELEQYDEEQQQGGGGNPADLRDASDVENSGVARWLDGIAGGFGDRFGPAFAAHDYRSMDDLYNSPPSMDDVAFILEETDAKITQAAVIMQVLTEMFATAPPHSGGGGGRGGISSGGTGGGGGILKTGTLDRKDTDAKAYNSYYNNRMHDTAGADGLTTPTPPHSPEPNEWQQADTHADQQPPDYGQNTTGEYQNDDFNNGGGSGGGGGDEYGGDEYGNIEDAPLEPEPWVDPSLVRGICGMCNKPVLVTQVRNKNSAGVYFHGNLDECVVATDLQ